MALLATVVPARAKVLCPPGRFTIQTAAAIHGRELVLGDGTVSLPGMCPVIHADRFTGHGWTHVSARWRRCPRRALAMRARFDLDRTSYCTRLEGMLRTASGRRVPFVADRIRECGNGVREDGEQCDGGDGAIFGLDCCAADCRITPGCPVMCDAPRVFPCEGADEICVHDCSFGSICAARAAVDCGTSPVCDCERRATYANRCAAWEAGSGVGSDGPCPQ